MEATPQARAQNLIRDFVEFSEKYSSQIPLAIPKGTLKTIDYYRDTYFKYLKDSEFKSNICYMLQLIEYQLWQYKLFKPQYSLESALFFQLLVTQGIIIEAVVFALIANPLVVSDTTDRSKGTTDAVHHNLLALIRRRTFSAHIYQLRAMKILDDALCNQIDQFRDEIRNLVHLQNWDGRLYRQIPQADYAKHLKAFEELLKAINAATQASHSLTELLAYYALDGRRVQGFVKYFKPQKGRGQIEARITHDHIPFFAEDLEANVSIRKGDAISFIVALGERGVRAISISRDTR